MTFKISTYHVSTNNLIPASVLLGVELVLVFLFCPETAYSRSADLNIDLGTEMKPIRTPSRISEPEKPWTFWEQLRPFNGKKSPDNLLKIIIRPLPLLLFPQVLYAFIIGLTHSWFSVLLGISSLIYGNPPYNLSVVQVGLLGIGGVIVSIISFISGPLNDWFCKFMARRNGGIYEPEVRISHILLS